MDKLSPNHEPLYPAGETVEQLRLIPYGSTQLRIAAFAIAQTEEDET